LIGDVVFWGLLAVALIIPIGGVLYALFS